MNIKGGLAGQDQEVLFSLSSFLYALHSASLPQGKRNKRLEREEVAVFEKQIGTARTDRPRSVGPRVLHILHAGAFIFLTWPVMSAGGGRQL